MRRINTSLLALGAIALTAILLAAGCSKETTNSNSSNSTTNSTTNAGANITPTSATPTATATPTASTGSPTDAFKAYYEATKAKDAEAVKRLFSKSTMKMLEDQAKQTNKSVDDVFKEGLEQASKEVPATMPEVRNEKIEGDKATIEIKDDKTGKWETFHLVKEDGAWKVTFGKE